MFTNLVLKKKKKKNFSRKIFFLIYSAGPKACLSVCLSVRLSVRLRAVGRRLCTRSKIFAPNIIIWSEVVPFEGIFRKSRFLIPLPSRGGPYWDLESFSETKNLFSYISIKHPKNLLSPVFDQN